MSKKNQMLSYFSTRKSILSQGGAYGAYLGVMISVNFYFFCILFGVM